MEFIESIHGKNRLLVHEGFTYRLGAVNKNGTKRYRCVKEAHCKGSITIDLDQIITNYSSYHTHLPQTEKIEAKKLMSDVKQRSIITAEKPRQVVLSCQTQLSEDAASAIPSYTSIYQTIRNKRKLELKVMPKNANSLRELVIPESLSKTRGREFHLFR